MIARYFTVDKAALYCIGSGRPRTRDSTGIPICRGLTIRIILYYFAYGSNLHPVRLRERVPSARLFASTELRGYRLAFHKQGADGSGKCNLLETGNEEESIHGAIYTLEPEHKPLLDHFEGRGYGYLDRPLQLTHQGLKLNCFTYLAQEAHIRSSIQPYHWYKELVLQGARHLNFPQAYVARIEAVVSRQDPEHDRRGQHEELLQRIHRYKDIPDTL